MKTKIHAQQFKTLSNSLQVENRKTTTTTTYYMDAFLYKRGIYKALFSFVINMTLFH